MGAHPTTTPTPTTLWFGCGPTAGSMTSPDEPLQRQLISAAQGCGIDSFDTAPIYGDGASERTLGRLLPELAPNALVSSKVFYQDIDAELRLDPADGFGARSIGESLTRLRRESLDRVFLHNRLSEQVGAQRKRRGPGPEIGLDEFLGGGGIADRLEFARERGQTRGIGLTGMGSEHRAIIEALRSGRVDWLTYDVNPATMTGALGHGGPSILDALREAVAHGVPVVALRVLGKGRFVGPLPGWDELRRAYPGIEEFAGGELWERCAERRLSLAQFATAFALSIPTVSAVIGGFGNLTHLREAVVAHDVARAFVKTRERTA